MLNTNLSSLFSQTTSSGVTASQVTPWLANLAYPLGKYGVLPFYFGQIKIVGQENLPRTGPVLLTPTHRSRWDAIMMGYAAGRCVTGRHLRFMVSIDEMKGLQGWLIRRLGGFPVDPRKLRVDTIQHSIDLLCQGEMLVVFPEGNIFRQRHVAPIKRGVATIALQAQSRVAEQQQEVKIVPMDIHYSDLFPAWGCDVTVRIGKPIHVSHYSHYSSKQASRKLTEDLQRALEGLGTGKSLLMGDRVFLPTA